MLGKFGLEFSTVLPNCHTNGILPCHGIRCVPSLWESSLGRTLVKKAAEVLVFWAVCRLCCWYFTVETAAGGEVGK